MLGHVVWVKLALCAKAETLGKEAGWDINQISFWSRGMSAVGLEQDSASLEGSLAFFLDQELPPTSRIGVCAT